MGMHQVSELQKQKQKFTELKEKKDKSTIIVGDFNIFLARVEMEVLHSDIARELECALLQSPAPPPPTLQERT